MPNYSIAVLVGTLRRESFNRRLATAIAKLAPRGFAFKQLEIGDHPLYGQDDDANPAAQVVFLQRWMDRYADWIALHAGSGRDAAIV